MISRINCPHCTRPFAFNTDRTPAQRGPSKNPNKPGRAVAYYPVCLYCRERVEVPAASPMPAPLMATARAG
jgi:hypothetical protein